MRPLASIRRAAPPLASVLLATVSQVALAQGFDKINTTVTNINTILVTISIAVVTIAIIWAGFKMDPLARTSSLPPTGGRGVGRAPSFTGRGWGWVVFVSGIRAAEAVSQFPGPPLEDPPTSPPHS